MPDPTSARPVIQVIAYGPQSFEEQQVVDADSVQRFIGNFPVTWINVDGLGDADTIRRLGEILKLHPLALEDTVNVHQRPKVEQYADQLFIVLRMIHASASRDTEQVAMFLNEHFVITFQEQLPGDSFEPVRERIRTSRGVIRERGCDHLAYAIVDAIIDGFFPVLEVIGEEIEQLEEETLSASSPATIGRIHTVKHDLLTLRRAVWPAREAVHVLARDPTPLVSDETRIYLRDCYDHTIQLLDLLETYREIGSDLRDLYVSSVSNRMNEIMKVLTMISTIFIPLSFLVGVYGMNFDPDTSPYNMPELRWQYGYLMIWGVTAVIVLAMVFFFRHKGWIGQNVHRTERPA